jgi:hypothetical protein
MREFNSVDLRREILTIDGQGRAGVSKGVDLWSWGNIGVTTVKRVAYSWESIN